LLDPTKAKVVLVGFKESLDGSKLTSSVGIWVGKDLEDRFHQRPTILDGHVPAVANQQIETLLPERFRAKHVEQRDGYFIHPQARSMGEGRELVGRLKGGQELPIEISLSPLHVDGGVLVLATVRDVSNRRRQVAELRNMEARYRTLAEGIPAVTLIAPLDGGSAEIFVSPQIEKLLGFTQREWVGNPTLWYTQLHPDDRARWHEEFARTVSTGATFRSVYRFIARDGRVVWVHGEAKVIRDESGSPQFLQAGDRVRRHRHQRSGADPQGTGPVQDA
jgi:PAS domain S-box-containing protein